MATRRADPLGTYVNLCRYFLCTVPLPKIGITKRLHSKLGLQINIMHFLATTITVHFALPFTELLFMVQERCSESVDLNLPPSIVICTLRRLSFRYRPKCLRLSFRCRWLNLRGWRRQEWDSAYSRQYHFCKHLFLDFLSSVQSANIVSSRSSAVAVWLETAIHLCVILTLGVTSQIDARPCG